MNFLNIRENIFISYVKQKYSSFFGHLILNVFIFCIKKAVFIWNDSDLEVVFRNNTWYCLGCLWKEKDTCWHPLGRTTVPQYPVVHSTVYTVTSTMEHCKNMFAYRKSVCRGEALVVVLEVVLVTKSGVVNC